MMREREKKCNALFLEKSIHTHEQKHNTQWAHTLDLLTNNKERTKEKGGSHGK